jgi:glycosyltransferase involved in cell wall biosynthesis
MITQPKISIITVVFNAVETLEETIKSVLAQTYQMVEFLIIDGGSTDGTLDILKRYQNPKINWISGPDKGIYDAMNKGIRMAKGEWIYFLGADDTFYRNNVLENIFSDEKNEGFDFLYGNVYAFALKRKYDGEFSRERILFQNISHQAIFYKKKIHDIVGYYNDQYKTFADWNLNIECFFHPEIKIKYIDIIIANFAEGGLGTSHPDLPFLRNYLFPKNLEILHEEGILSLKNIRLYDKWWRLLRSLRLNKSGDNLEQYSKKEKLPYAIQKIFNFQKRIPSKIIWIGMVSKSAMFLSYCLNRINKHFRT